MTTTTDQNIVNTGPFDPEARYTTASHWGVSYETGRDIRGAVLHVTHVDVTQIAPGTHAVTHHPTHHGQQFPNLRTAQEYAWRVGLTTLLQPRHQR
ncbi:MULTISPECIES: hypothetical protein [Streptomycetaceae]|uniref:hypothetical protein n=1 Tax=Streptomycetaceae TaxID=2062 RepID=UPI000213D996|nr:MULTISPECIES: hypothetical protein [Streptomycetaceae]MYS57723.1 hypothetical protein [Streptomyces sp. SID5468]CCB73342.1 protein of unknown function [Streptantibioticus cattleyicolor NRRL 8057 = DSM 46488]